MLYDLHQDPCISKALALIRVGSYEAAKEELVTAYGKAYMFGNVFTGKRILEAIVYLTWYVKRDRRIREDVYKRVYKTLFDRDPDSKSK